MWSRQLLKSPTILNVKEPAPSDRLEWFSHRDNHETPSRMRFQPDALISPACTSSTCQCRSPPRVKTEPFQWQARHSMGLWGQSQTLLTVLMTSSVITLPLLLTPALKNNICPVCHYQASPTPRELQPVCTKWIFHIKRGRRISLITNNISIRR